MYFVQVGCAWVTPFRKTVSKALWSEVADEMMQCNLAWEHISSGHEPGFHWFADDETWANQYWDQLEAHPCTHTRTHAQTMGASDAAKLAFAMSTHRRLGAESNAGAVLDADSVQAICSFVDGFFDPRAVTIYSRGYSRSPSSTSE